MTAHSPLPGLQFLTVADAAARLGVSRVRIREAAARKLIPSLRDNENRLRLDLSGVARLDPDAVAGDLSHAALMHVLFDEVEALHDELETARAQASALRDIADRQADALDRAADRLEREAADRGRLSDLLDRALTHLEAAGGDLPAQGTDASGDRLAQSLAQTARALDAAADQAARAGALEGTADRAMQLLDAALTDAEAGRDAADRTGDMLERALQTGERLERRIAEKDAELETRTATVDRVLQMSERAVALAAAQGDGPRKRTFWQWLTGR